MKKIFAQELRRRWESRNSYSIPLFIFLFFILFTNWTTHTISTILVNPLSSTIEKSNIAIDLVFIVASIMLLFTFISKAWKQVKISVFLEGIIICFSFIYFFYRFIEKTQFIFLTFNFPLLAHLFLADVIFVSLCGLIIYHILYLFRSVATTHFASSIQGFYTDSFKILDDQNDILSRRTNINRLKDLILNTYSPNHSFAIGIIGQWGTGKTTFLCTLEKELKMQKDVIIFRFNPWVSSSPEGITSIFFADLAKVVSRYDDSLRTDVLSYATELLQTIDNVSLSPIKKVFSYFSNEKESTERYEVINKSIQRLNKRIIILIDDVDRLAKDEVVEVLRIIRNTGNFGNIFFLVAFDRAYVKRSIEEILINDLEVNYLEKIFQLEYYLPIHSNNEIYKTALLFELKKNVNAKNVEVIDQIIGPQNIFFKIEVVPPLIEYIKSFRDVDRYMNVFLLNYKEIEEDVYLPDYLSICILRLKFPEVYKTLYYYRYYFLSAANTSSFFGLSEGVLHSQYEGDDKSKIENTKLYKFLIENKPTLGLNDIEVKDAANLVHSIFQSKGDIGTLTKARTLHNKHLSVTVYSCFNRYFDFSMEGRLDQKEFLEAMKMPIKDAEVLFSKWNSNRETNTDLGIKLENFEANNKELFEKYISLIVYYADLPVPESTNHTNLFNTDNFYAKLGGNSDEFNIVIYKLYSGNTESFKDFIRTLFLRNPVNQRWGFLQEFIRVLVNEYDNKVSFTNEELKEILKERFFLIIGVANTLSSEILRYYINTVRLYQNADIDSKRSVTFVGKSIEMSAILKPLALSDLHGLLSKNIYKDGRTGGYVLDDWPIYIFGSERAFQRILLQKKDEPIVDEYIQFCREYNKNKRPLDFKFKYLMIE